MKTKGALVWDFDQPWSVEEIDIGEPRKGEVKVQMAMGSVVETDVTLNLSIFTLMQKRLQGTIFGGGNPQHDIPRLLSMYQAGKLNLDDMVTRRYRLEQVNDGYRDMLEGRNIRGVIRYTDADR